MSESHPPSEEWEELDLSALDFEEFVSFFFAREVVSDERLFNLFLTDLSGERYSDSAAGSPDIVVKHLARLFTRFGQTVEGYSLAQIDQGIWGLWGPPLSLQELVFNSPTPLPSRLDCIRSMYFVYSDYVAKLQKELDPEEETGIYMWWDLVLHGFWDMSRPVVPGTHRGDPSKLDPESRALHDALFETLVRTLAIPSRASQLSSLHGLGHLHHVGVRDVVQRFIDTNPPGFNLKWLEECRDCSVL